MKTHLNYRATGNAPLGGHSANPVVKFIQDLWQSERHVLIVVCAALWVICPLDGDFLPIAGWVDDGFAMVLAAKHALDLFCRDARAVKSAVERTLDRDQPILAEIVEPYGGDVIDAEFTVVTESRRGW